MVLKQGQFCSPGNTGCFSLDFNVAPKAHVLRLVLNFYVFGFFPGEGGWQCRESLHILGKCSITELYPQSEDCRTLRGRA